MALDKKYGKIDIPGVPEDEPVFILRAQDDFIVPILARYRNLASGIEQEEHQRTDEWFCSFDESADAIVDWQSANRDRVKLPD